MIEGVIAAHEPTPVPVPSAEGHVVVELADRNLFREADRIAARASSPGTTRQYVAINRAFPHSLREQLGRPPVVANLDADVIAAYGRHLATSGGEGRTSGRARNCARVCVDGPRARPQLGREDAIAEVRAPAPRP